MSESNGHPSQNLPPKPSAEMMEAQLRSEVQSRRPSRWIALGTMILILVAPIAFALWWFWPEPEPPGALIVAMDVLATSEETPNLTAVVQWNDEDEDANRDGWPVLIVAESDVDRGESWHQSVRTSKTGAATAQLASASVKATSFKAVYAPKNKRVRVEDSAGIFRRPTDTPLILIDVEHSMVDETLEAWKTKNLFNIDGRSEVAKALNAAASKVKATAVYFACDLDRPSEYLKARNWVGMTSADNASPIPHGPVLGRINYAEIDPATALTDRAKQIKNKFTGKLFAVTQHPAVAAAFSRARIETILVGEHANIPAGVRTIKEWKDLPSQIE